MPFDSLEKLKERNLESIKKGLELGKWIKAAMFKKLNPCFSVAYAIKVINF